MENNIEIFNNSKFGSIRVIEKDGKVWFVGIDVAEVLGYRNPRKTISTKIKGEHKGVTTADTPGGKQQVTIIDEPALYKLAFSSKLDSAEEFTDWVVSDVLPSIRKTGAYMTPDTIEKMIANPDFSIKLLEELKEQQELNAELEKENNMLVIKNEFLETDAEINKPKVDYHDMVLNSDELVSATIIAKDYGKSAVWLNNKLHKLGVIYKRSGQWVLYDKYAEEGYCHSKTKVVGNGITMTHVYWTQKGRLFIYETLKANNILPLIEKEFVENNIEKDEID